MVKRVMVLAICIITGMPVFVYAQKKASEKKTVVAESKILAEVNGKKVYLEDFNKKWQRIPQQYKYNLTQEKFLDNIVQTELLAQEALKQGADKEKTYKQKLEDLKVELLASAFLEKEMDKKTQTTEEEIAQYYKEHKNEYSVPEEVNARHILIKTELDPKAEPDVKATANAKAEAEAKAILKQLKEEKADFIELAKSKSQDPGSAQNGGSLGSFSRGQMIKEFDDIAFALKEGEISDVVKTDFGYHIIKVD